MKRVWFRLSLVVWMGTLLFLPISHVKKDGNMDPFTPEPSELEKENQCLFDSQQPTCAPFYSESVLRSGPGKRKICGQVKIDNSKSRMTTQSKSGVCSRFRTLLSFPIEVEVKIYLKKIRQVYDTVRQRKIAHATIENFVQYVVLTGKKNLLSQSEIWLNFAQALSPKDQMDFALHAVDYKVYFKISVENQMKHLRKYLGPWPSI